MIAHDRDGNWGFPLNAKFVNFSGLAWLSSLYVCWYFRLHSSIDEPLFCLGVMYTFCGEICARFGVNNVACFFPIFCLPTVDLSNLLSFSNACSVHYCGQTVVAKSTRVCTRTRSFRGFFVPCHRCLRSRHCESLEDLLTPVKWQRRLATLRV